LLKLLQTCAEAGSLHDDVLAGLLCCTLLPPPDIQDTKPL